MKRFRETFTYSLTIGGLAATCVCFLLGLPLALPLFISGVGLFLLIFVTR